MLWACSLLPFTVIHIGTKNRADFHELRIRLLRKKLNHNIYLTNGVSDCILIVIMTKVFWFLIFCCLDSFLTKLQRYRQSSQTFTSQVPRRPEDCLEYGPFWIVWNKEERELEKRQEWVRIWLCECVDETPSTGRGRSLLQILTYCVFGVMDVLQQGLHLRLPSLQEAAPCHWAVGPYNI